MTAPAATAPRAPSEIASQWPLLAAAAAGVMVSFASVFIYSFGVFLKPLSAEFGWSRGQISAGFAIAALTVAAVSPFIGRIADRNGVRPVIVISSAVFALAFASLGALGPAIWQFYLTLFLIGCVGNGATQLTWGRAVTSRFDRQRGLALATMMMGGGIGSLLVPPLTTALLDQLGWRWAYAALGAAVLAVGPLIALLAPATRPAPIHRQAARGASPLRHPVFRRLLIAFFLVSIGANGCVAHLVPLMTDRQIAASAAATAAAVLGVSSVAGRLLTGLLIDRFFAPRIAFLVVGASAGGILVLTRASEFGLIAAAAAMIGFAMGAEADVFPYLISRYMGLASFTELYGYAFTAYAVGGALGPLLMGGIHDRTHSYAIPLVLGALATALAALLLLRLPRYESNPA